MFYLTVSKLLPYNATKIFLIGTICYILLHAYLYSKHVNETMAKYRHWFYYIIMADLIITGSFLLLFGKSKDASENHITTDVNDENRPKIAEVKKKLEELRALRKKNNEKEEAKSSIFIKKDSLKNDKKQAVPVAIVPEKPKVKNITKPILNPDPVIKPNQIKKNNQVNCPKPTINNTKQPEQLQSQEKVDDTEIPLYE